MAQDLPLTGIRVLDLSRHLPGPWCAQLLGRLGADVIKLEHRDGGDASRHNAPKYRRDSVYFHSVNAGKRSLTIDLKKEAAREIVRRLFAKTDVVLESFRSGGAARLGVDHEVALGINPALIYCSISGFGRSGPYAETPGHDLAIQALTGILGNHSPAVVTAANPPFHAADYAGGAMALVAILAALRRRDRTGAGGWLDIAMFDSVMAMGHIALASALGKMAGSEDGRSIEVWGTNPRYRAYPTGDGKAVAVCLLENALWGRFCRLIGRPDLFDPDESEEDRLSAHDDRAAAYAEAIGAYCLSAARDEIVGRMRAHEIPIMPVLAPDEALASELARSRGIVDLVEDRDEGMTAHLSDPLRRSGLSHGPDAAAPALGRDTSEILLALGYGEDEIAALRREAAI